jgi:hypothetical protein
MDPKNVAVSETSDRRLVDQVRIPLRPHHVCRYSAPRAVVVVEGAIARFRLVEATTMIVIGLILALFVAGFCCWLLFTLAVYAFPLFVGAAAAIVAWHSGAGVMGIVFFGVAAAAISLTVIRTAFASANSRILRGAITFFFAAPAVFAGYHATLGLTGIGLQSEAWRHVFAIIGAILVSGAASARVVIFRPQP